MTDTSNDIRRKIEHLEEMRSLLGDAAVDAAIAALRAQQPPDEVHSLAITSDGDNYGQNIGASLGRAIFGRDPKERERQWFVRYLHQFTHMLDQVALRRLYHPQSEQQANLSLPKVYTPLATTERVQVARGTTTELTTYLEHGKIRKEYTPDYALPDQAIIAIDQEHKGDARSTDNGEEATFTLWRAQMAVEAVVKYHHLVLLSDPGGGKSTFLRHLGWLVAQHTLEALPNTEHPLLPTELRTLLPILVPLSRLAHALERDDRSGNSAAAVVTATLSDVMQDYGDSYLTDHLREVLYRGTALILFDGLDEVPSDAQPGKCADRVTTLRAVREFAHRNPQTQIVVTCRTRAFESLRFELSASWHTATIAPFTLGQIRHFVHAWYGELMTERYLTAYEAEPYTRVLVDTLTASTRPRLREMAETPLLLTVMALVLYNKGELPRDRPKLYEAILELLLGQWDGVRDGQTLSDGVNLRDWTSNRIRPVLDRLSYEAHRDSTSEDGRGRIAAVQLQHAVQHHLIDGGLRDDLAAAAAVRCLQHFDYRSGLLRPDADDYVFAHLTLQEHCAGRHIALHSEDPIGLVMQHRHDDRWREPIFLGMGLADPLYLNELLHELVDRDEHEQPKPVERWYRDLILAAELGADRDWHYLQTQPRVKVRKLQAALKTGLVELLSDAAQPIPVTERLRAGTLLGDLGDPRFPVALDEWRQQLARRSEQFGAPDGYWCYVRPGTYQIGGWKDGEKSADHDLPGFWIARYPLTVAQYAAFLDDGGYQNKGYWTNQGWKWKQERKRTQPWGWDNSKYSSPNQAVIGVTWYECMAFCSWLTARLADTLPAGYALQLPTEAEWEAAAAYDAQMQRRTYPWGEDGPTPEHAIFQDDQGNKLGAPAPVGVCPAGSAACGALDMGGQVWEYCRSSHGAYPQGAGEGKSDFSSGSVDVSLRGGSWWRDRTNVRCAARLRIDPNFYVINFGCRVLLSPRVLPN